MYYFIFHEIFTTYEIDIVINSHFIEVKKLKPRQSNLVIGRGKKQKWSLSGVNFPSLDLCALLPPLGNNMPGDGGRSHCLDIHGFGNLRVIALPSVHITILSPASTDVISPYNLYTHVGILNFTTNSWNLRVVTTISPLCPWSCLHYVPNHLINWVYLFKILRYFPPQPSLKLAVCTSTST